MPTLNIKAYGAVINCDWLGGDGEVYIGVAQDEENHPEWWEYASWVDEKIYYYLTEEEMRSLKVGDILNDGEDFTIVEIDKDNPVIYKVDYQVEGVA